MNAYARFGLFHGFTLFAALTAIAIVGCSSSDTSKPSQASKQTANLGAAAECAGKACGVDCTPPGSDEPFNCNASRHCVSVTSAADLACTTCPQFVGDCKQGDLPADLDGDGCIDGCKPAACPEFLGDCKLGDVPADLNGDGCIDGCRPAR